MSKCIINEEEKNRKKKEEDSSTKEQKETCMKVKYKQTQFEFFWSSGTLMRFLFHVQIHN